MWKSVFSLFSYYFKMWSPLLKSLCFSLLLFIVWQITLSSLLNGCYHCFVFTDPLNGYSKSKLLVKKQVALKSKIRFRYVFCNFCYHNFLLWSIFSPLVDVQLKQLSPLQGLTNCMHSDKRAYKVHPKRFTWIYVHANQSKHIKVVLRYYLK